MNQKRKFLNVHFRLRSRSHLKRLFLTFLKKNFFFLKAFRGEFFVFASIFAPHSKTTRVPIVCSSAIPTLHSFRPFHRFSATFCFAFVHRKPPQPYSPTFVHLFASLLPQQGLFPFLFCFKCQTAPSLSLPLFMF